MTDFNVCFINKLKWPARKVEVFEKSNDGWDSVDTVDPDGNTHCSSISSSNDSITIKVVPEGGVMNHQNCDIKHGHGIIINGPDLTDEEDGWIIEITRSRQEGRPENEPGTTTVEISDNQPGAAQGEETNKE
jgi:hypothetical protein